MDKCALCSSRSGTNWTRRGNRDNEAAANYKCLRFNLFNLFLLVAILSIERVCFVEFPWNLISTSKTLTDRPARYTEIIHAKKMREFSPESQTLPESYSIDSPVSGCEGQLKMIINFSFRLANMRPLFGFRSHTRHLIRWN